MRMELAAALLHSAFKGAGPVTNDAVRSQKTVNSREDAVFFELYDEETAGWRPPCVGAQARVQRHTVEQIIDTALGLPKLDVPVPLMVEQTAEVLHFFDAFSPSAEQVTDVPKIILEEIPMPWFASRRWWSSWWKCRQSRRPLALQSLPFFVNSDQAVGRVYLRMAAPPAQAGIEILGAVPAPKIHGQIAAVAVDTWASL